jgi:aspartate/tyrosine/aromatic aminotransferase
MSEEYQIMKNEIRRLHSVCREKDRKMKQILQQIETMTRNNHSSPPIAKLQMINKICNDALKEK